MDQATNTRQLLSRNNLWREIWTYLPIWFVYLQAIGLLNFIMANVPKSQFLETGFSRHWFALTALPPLLWFYAYYRNRLRQTERDIDKTRVHKWILGLTFGVPLAIWLFYAILPFSWFDLHNDGIRSMFEYMQLFWVAMFIVHVLYHGGMGKFTTFFIVAWIYGLLLENSGIIMGYFFEPGYKYYLGPLPAPFATMMGWCLVFYCCIWITEYFRQYIPRLRQSVLLSSLFTTAIALSMDGQIDPLASLSGYFWNWATILPDWWLNVPFCNYAAWFGAFMAFSLVYFYFFDREDLNIWQRNIRIFLYVPMIVFLAGGLWMALMIVYEGGFDGPIFQILDQFIGRVCPSDLQQLAANL